MGELTEEAMHERITRVCASAPLRLAVLFGSRSTETARADSDVDVAIVPMDAAWPLAKELAFARRLSAAAGVEVDVVRLDTCSPLLGREVARDGRLLYEHAPGEFATWRARAVSEWIDFDETIAPHRLRFLQRLARNPA